VGLKESASRNRGALRPAGQHLLAGQGPREAMSLLEWLIERTRSRTKKFGGDRPISLLVQRRPKASKDRSSFPSVIYKPERLPGPRVRMCKEGLITRRKR
jgi:hypothetical protein